MEDLGEEELYIKKQDKHIPKVVGKEIAVSQNEKEMIVQEDTTGFNTLDQFHAQYKDCMCCPLGSSRQNIVFGAGNPQAKLMLIGEAPGAEEDKTGLPFVGRAGHLLDKILAAIDLKREEIFIGSKRRRC